MKNKNTNEIINDIKHSIETIKYPSDNFIKVEQFYTLIQKRIKELSIKQINLIKEIGLDEQNGYKYLNGSKKINRDLAIKILISLNYSFDEIQSLLKIYQYPILYPKIKRDYLIITSIINNNTVDKTNEVLSLNNEFLL